MAEDKGDKWVRALTWSSRHRLLALGAFILAYGLLLLVTVLFNG